MKDYIFVNPLITNKDSIKGSCYRDCHNNYSPNYKNGCMYDIKLTNITNNEIIYFTISGKNMNLYDLSKKLKVAGENGFLFYQINKLTIKFHLLLQYLNIIFYQKFQIPMCHRQFYRVISQNREYVEKFCNDVELSLSFSFCMS